jgi:hypothetical protein
MSVASAPTARPALVARVILVRKRYPPERVLEAVEVKKVRDTEGVASLENERALEKIRKDMAKEGNAAAVINYSLVSPRLLSHDIECDGALWGELYLEVPCGSWFDIPVAVDLALT